MKNQARSRPYLPQNEEIQTKTRDQTDNEELQQPMQSMSSDEQSIGCKCTELNRLRARAKEKVAEMLCARARNERKTKLVGERGKKFADNPRAVHRGGETSRSNERETTKFTMEMPIREEE